MTADTSGRNEITQLLQTFAYFIAKYEADKLSDEDVKKSFEAAVFIEKSVKILDSKLLFSEFMLCFNLWWKSKNKTLIYSEEFFRYACDNLLLKYLRQKENDLDIILKLYTSTCSKERFQNVVEKAILKTASSKPILKYTVAYKNIIDKHELHCRIILTEWTLDVQRDNSEQVKKSITDKFEPYVVDKQLPILITILCLDELKSEELAIKTMILNELLFKMEDRSVLSNEFWLTLTKKIGRQMLLKLCQESTEFCTALLNFLIYCGGMMDYELGETSRLWSACDMSICPGITYDDITSIISLLTDSDTKLLEYIKNRIEETKSNSQTYIWSDIMKICF